ncbi:Lipase member K [Wickerhamomyces ciferrii]|uniref:Lipase member K n=1 Tax=Wickerhamomyces ciferrii (strain ATCC 14091 / BCRC 22168 / CBS 111 / JCM 3599 / NBRC 0793 / NRRL Y-1031 F-60-10) TaxID=1206466 RepID=K0KE48_WICCF|nr:Lipase member K [Wickerhamomyces ciferrii]CCH40517.1 Lipase member K [Wickerhamomyces ciferrii]
MAIPLLGRLNLLEWPLVIISFLFAYIEFIISIITKCLPNSIIHLFTNLLNQFYTFFILSPNDQEILAIPKTKEYIDMLKLRNQIKNCESILDIGAIFGYEIDDHIVETRDGYLLCLHRIKPKQQGAPIVYLHHGLLMCSDIWCTNIEKHKNLPFLLHDLGFDVFIGNNRGNKYSTKHIRLKPNDIKFWDFSIDEFAIYDIPDSINYILNYTNQKSLTYIGFSQGSAQAFAALSINPLLNKQIKLFIALSPAMTPRGLHHKVVDALIKTSPNIMYLIFGKKTLLPTASFWESIIYPPLFVKIIDLSNEILFNWKSKNINFNQKISSYSHLYSPTSVKSIVHWFQIIRNSNFQMFDEDLSITNTFSKPFKTPNFPSRTNIKVPIRLLYGTIDSLVDIDEMLKLLPTDDIKAIGIDEHEHLDLIWGDDIEELVYPHILKFLDIKNQIVGDLENEKVSSF